VIGILRQGAVKGQGREQGHHRFILPWLRSTTDYPKGNEVARARSRAGFKKGLGCCHSRAMPGAYLN
ncbi:MAG TPA: hypothetical protein VNB78_09470, partial [Sphingomicrobium sp.]|nr:hypothetical protein [Sphingomicrobium sp.]